MANEMDEQFEETMKPLNPFIKDIVEQNIDEQNVEILRPFCQKLVSAIKPLMYKVNTPELFSSLDKTTENSMLMFESCNNLISDDSTMAEAMLYDLIRSRNQTQ